MTQLDRSVAPAIRQLEHFSILQPELHRMKNGMPLYVLSAGNEDVIRFDLLVRSGQLDQSQPLQAVFTNRMLREGTVRMTSGEIAERLDYYGAWLDLSSSVNCGFVTLYTLTKHLDRTMEIVAGLVKESVFPEEQFRIICDINRQQFLVNNRRVDVLARKQLNRSLFGTSHPLGRYAELEDYERIQVEALKDFYHRHYHSGNCSMYVSGKVRPRWCAASNVTGESALGKLYGREGGTHVDIVKDARKRVHVEKEDALQSSLRMGGFSLDRKHPDYLKLRVLVTLFGGYFGSRLMSNIREDKGYTYGIGAGLVSYPGTSLLVVSTEAANEYMESVITEVYHEMDRLRQDKCRQKNWRWCATICWAICAVRTRGILALGCLDIHRNGRIEARLF